MAKRSIRYLLRRKSREQKTSSPEKETLSPEMRNLMVSFEAQYGHRDPEPREQPRL